MKNNITNILLSLLIGIIVWNNFFDNHNNIAPTIPEESGTSGKHIIERVIVQPIYIPSSGKTVNVDKRLKDLYDEAVKHNDSLKQRNLFLESIKIRDYKEDIVDNDTIKLTGNFKVRGSLLGYKVDYKIKEREIPDKFKYKLPRLSAKINIETGMPTLPETPFLIKGTTEFINNKGNGISIGYDNQKRVWFGISKTFTLKR